MAKNERARADSRLVLFILSLNKEDLDQVNQSEPTILGTFRLSSFASSLSTTTSMAFESYRLRHSYMYVVCICIAAVSIIGILSTAVRTMAQPSLYPVIDDERDARCPQFPIRSHNHLDPMNYLNGPPTERFRGSLCFSMDLNALAEDIYL